MVVHASAWPGLKTPRTGHGWAKGCRKPHPGAMMLGGGCGGAPQGTLQPRDCEHGCRGSNRWVAADSRRSLSTQQLLCS